MSDILNQIAKTNPKKSEELKKLAGWFSQKSETLKERSQNQLTGVLADLVKDPKSNTVGVIWVMYLKIISSSKLDVFNFMQFGEILVNQMWVPHLSYGAKQFGIVVEKMCGLYRAKGLYSNGWRFCVIGINVIGDSTLLTPFHHNLLTFLLKLKQYKVGERQVSAKILNIKPEKNGLTPTAMIAYYYYAGLLYIGLKQYKDAMEAFEMGLSVPTLAFHAIQIEIFKKYVFVSLLTKGKFGSLPTNSSQIIKRHMKNYCNFYMDFAKAFANKDFTNLHKIFIEQSKGEFKKDTNLGLAKQCMEDFHRKNILRLTQTYIKISLQDIAKAINTDSVKVVERYLLQMIEKGEVDALINQKDGMVEFVEKKKKVLNSKDLSKRINNVIRLTQNVKSIDDDLRSSIIYLAKIHGIRDQDFGGGGQFKHQGMGGGGVGGGMFGMLKGFQHGIQTMFN